MNKSHDNPAFEGDEKNTASDKELESKGNVYSLDIGDVKKTKQDEPYDPHKHREVKHPTTDAETLLHLLKGSLGTGILAMPNAMYHAGYVLGIIGTILIGCICIYCVHLLIKAQYELCKRRKKASYTYPQTIEEAFMEGPPAFQKMSPYSGHLVNITLLIYQMGTCCVYTMFVASNMHSVGEQYWSYSSETYFALMFLIPLILINWIRNLKLLAPFSTVANVITFVGFGIIIYYLFAGNPSFEGKEAVGKLEDLPLFFGTVLFALEAIGVIMPLENEMKTPKSFGGSCGVLNIGMITIIVLYVFMGFLGYLTYGPEAKGTVTLNIPPDEILAQVVKVSLALAIYITHALQCYVAVDIAWNMYLSHKFEKSPRKLLYEYILRTSIVLITFGLAVAIPKLELFISLFGALCLSVLGIAFPALIDMSTHWYDYSGRKYTIMMIQNTFLVLFAILGLVVGTYMSLSKIIEDF